MYTEKLDKIVVREAGQIDYKAYKVDKKYILYIKIPSEVVPKFYYDVLIEFSEPKDQPIGDSLKNYSVRFFSNDPSFVFTFAYAFKKNRLFLDTFEGKMSKKALKTPAKEKNPYNQVGYVKSLYFAYLVMTRRGLFSKSRYVDTYSESALKKEIMDADKKIELREEAGKKVSSERRKDRQRLKREERNNVNTSDTPTKQPPIRKTKNIGVIGKTANTVKNKYIKKTVRK
jgi:hypothetical protein